MHPLISLPIKHMHQHSQCGNVLFMDDLLFLPCLVVLHETLGGNCSSFLLHVGL